MEKIFTVADFSNFLLCNKNQFVVRTWKFMILHEQ